MTWTPKAPSEAHRHALLGHDVVGVLSTRIPFVAEAAAVEVASARPLTVLEEFTVRAVLEIDGLQDAGDVSDLLGLGQPSFVEPIVSRLGQTRLVGGLDGGPLVAEPGLRDLYDRRAWEEIDTTTITGLLCPLTGERHAEVEGLSVGDGPAGDVPPPDADAFADWATSDGAPLASVDRDRIREVTFQERSGGLGLPCDVVVYTDDAEGTWYWEPYLPGEGRVAVEYREVCRGLGADEAALSLVQDLDTSLPPDPPAESAVRERVATLDSEGGLTVKRYGTAGARQAIADRIASAKHEVVASFPWIKSGALSDDLLKAIKKALSRGASVYIAYGIAGREADEDSHPEAIARLRGIQASNTGRSVHVAWVGHSHAKEVVVDRAHYLGGSFNRFSFRGDPSRGGVVRRESMIYTNDEDVVGDARTAIVPVLQAALVRDTSQEPAPPSAEAWVARWRSIFRLDWTPNVLRAALETAPTSGKERADILLRLMALVKKERLTPERAESFLTGVPAGFVGDGDDPHPSDSAMSALSAAAEDLERSTGADLSTFQAALRQTR